MTNHCAHHHVEDGGGEGISLGDPPADLEWESIIVPLSGHHEEVIPTKSEDPLCTWSNPISHQYPKPLLPAKGLSEVKEYLVEDLITHLRLSYWIGLYSREELPTPQLAQNP